MERRLYLIPGVATDRRVFAGLELGGYDQVHLDWIQPQKAESIRSYAERMVARLDGDQSPILIGYSFGGLIAQEMAKLVPEATVILISSIKSYRERPMGMWLTASFGLHRVLPSEIGKEFRFAYTWMNDPQNEEERAFIRKMREELNHHHTDWAIDQAVNWRHDDHTPRLFHIHGDRDRIFPIRYIRNCIPVRGGTHLMLLNKAPEITAHIHRIVQAVASRRMPA
jgi:pimeloyl-ACP methyl ester carboxylesterase